MVPRSPLLRFTSVQVLLMAALFTNAVTVNGAISQEFGGRSNPLNPVGSDLAAASYFLSYELGPDISEKLALAAVSSYAKNSRSAAFYMANLQVAMVKIKKHPLEFAFAQPYAKVAMDGYYNLAEPHHRHGMYEPLGCLYTSYLNVNQPELALKAVRYQLARLEDQKHELQCKDEHCDYLRLAEAYKVGTDLSYELGYYATAEQYAKKALMYSHMSGEHRRGHLHKFELEQYIAMSLIKQERYAEALPYAEALDRRMASAPHSWSDTAKIFLALIYEKLGRTDESQSAFSDEDGRTFEACINSDAHVQYCTANSFYADLIDARGQHQKAADLMQSMIDGIDPRDVSPENRFKCKNRLAQFLNNAGSPQKAVAVILPTLQAREAMIGPFSLDTAKTYALLADAQFKLHQSGDARQNLDRAIRIESLTLDPDGPLATRHHLELGLSGCSAVLTGMTYGKGKTD